MICCARCAASCARCRTQADAARRHDGVVAELQRDPPAPRRARARPGLQLKTDALPRAGLRPRAATETRSRAACGSSTSRCSTPSAALTDVGHGDVGDTLARVEAMREPARGLRALVVERRRGLERELAAAADEGVVETLVADAGAVRAELDALEPEAGSLAEQALEVERAERDVTAALEAFLVAADGSDPVAEAEAVRGSSRPDATVWSASRRSSPVRRPRPGARGATGAARARPRRRDGATAGRDVDGPQRRGHGRDRDLDPSAAPRRSSPRRSPGCVGPRPTSARGRGAPMPWRRRSTRWATPTPSPRSTASPGSPGRWSTTSSSSPARSGRWRPRSATPWARWSSPVVTRPAHAVERLAARRRVGLAAGARRRRQRRHRRGDARAGRQPTARGVPARRAAGSRRRRWPVRSVASCSPTVTGVGRWTSRRRTRS